MTPFNTEWLNSNHFRAYPFREDASLQSTDGYVLPNEILLDLVLVSFPTAKLPLYVSQVTVTSGICEVRIADSDGTVVTSTVVNVTAHTDPQSYNITGLNAYTAIRGHVILGDLLGAAAKGTGTHVFLPAATKLLDTCVLPSTPRVESLAALTADGIASTGLTGAVQLKAGTNIRLMPLVSENAIQIDSVPMEVDCSCNDPFCGFDKPISRVNGISADSSCGINIRGVGCIQVTAQNNIILIEDTCYEPCNTCCDQLKAILQTIESLEASSGTGAEIVQPYIYDVARPDSLVCTSTVPVGALVNKTYGSTLVKKILTNGCPATVTDSLKIAEHSKFTAEAVADGFYVLNDDDYFSATFKVKNDGLTSPKGFYIGPQLTNDLTSMGLHVIGKGSDTLRISGSINFNVPALKTAEVANTGFFGFTIWYISPTAVFPPVIPGYTIYAHRVEIMLRGYPGFPVV
jgi:hypothetical protein